MRLTATSPWSSRGAFALDGAVVLGFVVLAWVLPIFLPAGEPTIAHWPGLLGFCTVAAAQLVTWRLSGEARVVAGAVTASVLILALLLAPTSVITADDTTSLWMTPAAAGAGYGSYLYRRSRARSWIMLVVLTLVVANPWALSFTMASTGLLYVTTPMLFGMFLTARRTLVMTLTERAERAEREQHLLAERARAQERTRLAAEMHDIVTHRISLMVLHAGALRVTATDETTRETAEEVRATGSAALEELRDLIGVLRATPQAAGRAER